MWGGEGRGEEDIELEDKKMDREIKGKKIV